MSNFICPTCGFNNIDCGKAGCKTAREIELKKKLEIAVKALEEISHEILLTAGGGCYVNTACDKAQEALAKIKGD